MKRIFTLALGATFALAAFAEQGHISLLGVDYTVDTLFHAKVGPGTTQTQLRLEGPSPLNVFYLTVDRTTPNDTIRSVSALYRRTDCCTLPAPTATSIGQAVRPPTALPRWVRPRILLWSRTSLS